MIKKINFFHSLIFFNICIFISSINYLNDNNLIVLCLFLILTVGISHGSLDNLKGKILLRSRNIKSISIFYIGYVILSIFVILFWMLFPSLLLTIFLLVASYHFGKEDSDFIHKNKNNKIEILYFFKGSSIIFAPLLFHKEKTIEIFDFLNFEISNIFLLESNILILLLIISFVATLLLSSKKNYELKLLLLMDYLSILILNYFLNPILAFTIYFCFLHSIRHSLSLIFQLNRSFNKGFKAFIKKAMPLTIVTAIIYLFSLLFLNNYLELNDAIYKVIFIGLASLTFPHILLEYLVEKNEK